MEGGNVIWATGMSSEVVARRRAVASASVDRSSPPMPARGRLYDSVLETIGATPLVRVPRLAAEQRLLADLALKLEFFNPLASVKDRVGLAMVDQAEAAGLITRGRSVLVEPTSGNTGLALGLVAAAKGYRVIVTMPEGSANERRKMLRLMGVEVELTPARQGMAGAIARAEAIVAGTPHAWMPRQFDNPANPAAHAATTAEEIWIDTDGEVDVVVGGVGTGGTLTGIARALKPRRPGLLVYAVEPADSAVLSGDAPGSHGIQGIGPGFKPGVLELELMDGVVRISEAEAIAAARQCARLEAADRHIVRRSAARGTRSRARSGARRQADRRHRALVRRALPVNRAVRRPLTGREPQEGHPVAGISTRRAEDPMPGHGKSSKREPATPASKGPHKPASPIEDDNIRAASRAMPGSRDALPPGSLPEQTPDSQGDQNMDPVVQPGRGNPRRA